jgi:hypothetical protein
MIYDLLKRIVLDYAPGAGCPSEWGLIDADYCDSFCDSASDTCEKCWQSAIEEAEKE